MISNLNPLSFQSFGRIDPERVTVRDLSSKVSEHETWNLEHGDAPVYVASDVVWLYNQSNMTVLSVSTDGEEFRHFYLDKLVRIQPGVRFSVRPYLTSSSVEIGCSGQLQEVGRRGASELQMKPHFSVGQIFTLFYQEKERGFVFPGEEHIPYELMYVDKGTVHSVVNGVDMVLNQGDLVLYGSNQWHMQYSEADMSPSFVTITFDLAQGSVDSLVGRKLVLPQAAVAPLRKLLKETDQLDDYSEDVMICALQMLLLTLLRDQQDPESVKLRTTNSVNSENEIIRRAQQFVASHVREKLNVPTVAKFVEVSPSYLTALFRKNLQISPGEYIRRVKLQESKQMIREDNCNFTEIAAALHYSTVHHFSRQFKEKFGITPTEYAKSVR